MFMPCTELCHTRSSKQKKITEPDLIKIVLTSVCGPFVACRFPLGHTWSR